MYDPHGSRKAATPTSLEGLEARFHALPLWQCYGLIGLNGIIVIALCALFVSMISEAFSPPQQPDATAQVSTPTPATVPTSMPTPSPASSVSRSAHYPPTIVVDLFALAAKGDAGAIHEFHSENVGTAGCPQPKREVAVDPGVTGQQLAQDLLSYFYAQRLDNTCGALVLAYHNQSEAGDAYTVGRISVDVTGSNGMANTDPNASNLTHKLTLDIGGLGANQEYIVTY